MAEVSEEARYNSWLYNTKEPRTSLVVFEPAVSTPTASEHPYAGRYGGYCRVAFCDDAPEILDLMRMVGTLPPNRFGGW